MKQVASLRYGVIFKKAFSDVDVFKGFVRDILGIHLKIDKVETEKEYKPAIGQVAVKFDLYAQDDEGRVIVEIQHQNYADHYDRFLHYHCVALLEQVKTAKNYRSPLAVYTIVVLTSADPRYKEDVLTIDFDLKNKDGKSLKAIPHKIIYLCPKYLDENTPLPYREWLEVISDSLDNQVDESHYHLPEISKVLDYIEADVSPEEKARMIDEYNFEEWRKEGIKERMLEMAKTMLQEGFTLAMISKLTGLDEQTVLAISMNDK
jgi:predicted transposase/invertase (TIGR01784 family)